MRLSNSAGSLPSRAMEIRARRATVDGSPAGTGIWSRRRALRSTAACASSFEASGDIGAARSSSAAAVA